MNNENKEMLEYAAKAMGIEGQYFESDNPVHTGIYRAEHSYYWNPLISDSEAFRMAVELRISVEYNVADHIENVATISFRNKWGILTCISTVLDDNQMEHVRRCIVRAASLLEQFK